MGPLIGAVIGVVLYDLFIGDVLHARLRKAEEVAGPIPETQLADQPAAAVSAEGTVPQTRQPDASETPTQGRDSRRT